MVLRKNRGDGQGIKVCALVKVERQLGVVAGEREREEHKVGRIEEQRKTKKSEILPCGNRRHLLGEFRLGASPPASNALNTLLKCGIPT